MQASRFWQNVKYALIGAMGMAITMRVLLDISRHFSRETEEAITLRKMAVGSAIPALDAAAREAPQTHLPSMVDRAHIESRFTEIPTNNAVSGRNNNRHVMTFAGVALMLAVIAGTFLYSGHVFSGLLQQTGDQSSKAIAAQAQLVRPAFERGIIFPQWSTNAYGAQDAAWQREIGPMKGQTGAQWIEIPVLFSQATPSSTTITTTPSTPQIGSFIEGIQRAHGLGYKVFFVPLMQVRQPGMWSGSITFSNAQQEQAWFTSYWNAIEPYVAAAASQHVEQMAIGTELQTLQQIVPDLLWNQLIARIHRVFGNPLTYDMNWSSLGQPMAGWLENPGLAYIGVSTYIPLLDVPGRADPGAMPALWRNKIKTQLDGLSAQLNKPVLITEIGYRNSADALYHTWEATSKARPDPQEQAGAYEAALSSAFSDPHIAGTFFWGWDDVGMFAIKEQPARQVLLKWYGMTMRAA